MSGRMHAGGIAGWVCVSLLVGCAGGPKRAPDFNHNVTNQVRFQKPDGMQIGWRKVIRTEVQEKDKIVVKTTIEDGWQTPQVIVPSHANFAPGAVTPIKLTSVPGRADKAYYGTIEMRPRNEATQYYLAHTAVPVVFTDEDFDQVDANNFVTKVVYLPAGEHQELALGGDVEMLVATRLDPGEDPIQEAQKKGQVLLVIRMGNRVPE